MQFDQEEQQLVKKKRSRSQKGNVDSIPAFLLKTYEIVDNPTNNDVISWNDEGNAFIVKKVNEFSDTILPKSFKHNNFASFVRQLNMYDFHKTRHDNNENEFKHKQFLKGKKHLLNQIKRKTNDQKEQNSLSIIKQEVVRNGQQSDIPEILGQMSRLQNKQNELEKLMKILIKQNDKILKENKYLWTELMKNKQKNDNSDEQIMKWMLQSLHTNKQNGKHKVQNNQFLMLKQTSENDDDFVSLDLQYQKQFENEQIKVEQIPQQILPQSLEQQIEKFSKAQILQVLLKVFNQKQDKKTKYDDDEMSFEEEYPVHKKIDTKEQEEKKQENQLMVYSEPFYLSNKLADENNNYIIESSACSRKNSFYDHDPIPQFQFFEE